MSFWKRPRISWILVCCVAFALGRSPGAEETFAPWLFHPVQGGASLCLRHPQWRIDYGREPRPHWVHIDFSAELEHRGSRPLTEQFLVVCADEGLKVSWEGRSIAQQRLVSELPRTLKSRLKGMARVAIFQLILLGNEKGKLNISGYHRVEFLSKSTHRWQLLPPVMRAWEEVGDGGFELRLSPELRLLSPGWKGDSGLYRRSWDHRDGLPLEVRVEAPTRAAGWTVLQVPPLRLALIWGTLLTALAVLGSFLVPRLAWFFWVLTCAGLWGAPRWLPALSAWNYYADARLYEQWLATWSRGVVPALAAVACWLASRRAPSRQQPHRVGNEENP